MIVHEEVILIDENDRNIGTMEKLQAHKEGLLHRAFSIFIFNKNRELLLQKRADSKYHSAGLWTNSCCGHPRPGECTEAAAGRRLYEEVGIRCALEKKFSFQYKAPLDHGLWEHELDYVFFGFSDHPPILNEEEASELTYASMDDIRKDLSINPHQYTHWFTLCFERVYDSFEQID